MLRGCAASDSDFFHTASFRKCRAIEPSQLSRRDADLLRSWHERHEQLRIAGKTEIIAALAEFHHGLLRIHPFLDSNGRVARCVLDQAARELLNQSIGPAFVSPPAEYYSALQAADKGDYGPLIQRITASLV